MNDMLGADEPGQPCSDCGFTNPSSERFCLACNSQLGVARATSRPDAEASTSRYRQIRQKCEEVQTGHVTVEHFVAYMTDLSNILSQRAQSIYDNFQATDYWSENGEECEIGVSGVESYEAGVNEIWAFIEDGDPSHINEGLVMIWEGNQRIIEAMRINRENREALALLWDQLQDGIQEAR